MQHETVIVLDLGGQYNQLIARASARTMSTVKSIPIKPICRLSRQRNPQRGIIFTGGPNSVYLEDSPTIDP